MAESTDENSTEYKGTIKSVHPSGSFAVISQEKRGSENILLPRSVMNKTGFSCFNPGVKIVVLARRMTNGLKATEVLALDGVRYHPDLMWTRGFLTDYDSTLAIGRVKIGDSRETFIHGNQLRAAGLRNISDGTEIEVLWEINSKGPTVTMVRLPEKK